VLTARFKERTRDDWVDAFAGTDACVEPVLSLHEATVDAHLVARHTYAERAGATQPAPSPRFSRTPGALSLPPPVPGQHTIDALIDWGILDAADLVEKGAAVQA
jgi:alpha-methylacyl-CoA racemase